jgi:hypothetical protein
MGRRRDAIEQLRTAIDCLPVHTRVAMLEGVRENDIIVGAYTDRDGGICPMLAAHRHGGRTDFITFARSWDRFTGVKRGARRATDREVRILVAHLEASLFAEERTDLAQAIREHGELVGRRREQGGRAQAPAAANPRPGDADRLKELRRRAGWAWLRPFRRLDDYERALARVEAERDALRDEVGAGV